jgi:biopolymer transport protein TolR
MADPNNKPDEKMSAAQRSKIRRLSAPKHVDAADEAGELNIVPFLDIITNVLMFVLASITVSFTVTLDADAPKGGGKGVRAAVAEESLNLTVIIASDGYFIKGKAASIAPGCAGIGGGAPTVPRVSATQDESSDGKKYDTLGLQRCARKLKEEVPNAAEERQVMVTANPNVPFQEIVRVMDAVRLDDKGELFPNVVFTVLK